MIRCIKLSFLALSLLYHTSHAQQEKDDVSETMLSFEERMTALRGTNNLRGLQESSNVCRPVNTMTVALPDMTGLKCDNLPKYSCSCSGSTETTCNYCSLRTHPQFVQCQVSGSVLTFKDENYILTTCSCEYAGNGEVEQVCYQNGVLVAVPGSNSTESAARSPTSAPVAEASEVEVITTTYPPSPTPAPVIATTGTPAPVPAPTSAPVTPTMAPVTPTMAPVTTPTMAPITPTAAPVTRAPIIPTNAPVVPAETASPPKQGPGGPGGPGDNGGNGGNGRKEGPGISGRFGGFW